MAAKRPRFEPERISDGGEVHGVFLPIEMDAPEEQRAQEEQRDKQERRAEVATCSVRKQGRRDPAEFHFGGWTLAMLLRAWHVLTCGRGGSRSVGDRPPEQEREPDPEPSWKRNKRNAGQEPPWRKKSRTGASTDTPPEDPNTGELCSCRCAEDLDPGDSDIDVPLDVDGEIVHMTRCSCRECPGLNGRRCRALLALTEDQRCWLHECFACTSTHGSGEPRKRTSVFTSPNASYTRTDVSYHLKGKTSKPTSSWNVGPASRTSSCFGGKQLEMEGAVDALDRCCSCCWRWNQAA